MFVLQASSNNNGKEVSDSTHFSRHTKLRVASLIIILPVALCAQHAAIATLCVTAIRFRAHITLSAFKQRRTHVTYTSCVPTSFLCTTLWVAWLHIVVVSHSFTCHLPSRLQNSLCCLRLLFIRRKQTVCLSSVVRTVLLDFLLVYSGAIGLGVYSDYDILYDL